MLNVQQPNPSAKRKLSRDQLMVRINGTLPDTLTLGSIEKSQRAAEVKEKNITTNTFCSLFADVAATTAASEDDNKTTQQVF
jgi:hypothetical protein